MRRQLAGLLGTVVLVGLVPSAGHTQAMRTAHNAVYLELGGNGLLYSVNYERFMAPNVSLRGGFSYVSVEASDGTGSASASVAVVPLMVNYLLGGGSAKLEVGGGIALTRFSGESSTGFGDEVEVGAFVPIGTGTVAFRLSPPGGGFNFKIGWTPFFHPDIGLFNWGGLALGAGF